jgi:hypothetical protein
VTGCWIKLHNEELHDLYSSFSGITMSTSKRLRWVGHVARAGQITIASMIWWYSRKERYHLEELGVDDKVTLKMYFIEVG